MSDMQDATIQDDGTVFDGDGIIRVFKVETPEKTFWFEFDFEVAENGVDFWIAVNNFGLVRRSAAGSKTPLVRWKFTADEARVAQARLREFFFGSQEKNIAPFPIPSGSQSKVKCLGIKFSEGWITIEKP